MVIRRRFACLAAFALFLGACIAPAVVLAASDDTEETGEPETNGSAIRVCGLALGAALAIGLAGLATAKVQAAVGAGGTGALAEKPELFTSILVLYAIPETIVVLGFVIAILIVRHI